MRDRRWGIAVVVVAAVLVTAVPAIDQPAAACSPRLFRELGPAPNDVSPPDTPPPPAEGSEDAAPPAEAEPEPSDPPVQPTPPPPRCSFVYRMDHPVLGDSAFISVFGAVRDAGDRWHAGVDISAPKMTPVVAVRSGVLIEVNRNGAGDCCWVKIQHTDGWQSVYVHLNNDRWGTDDGAGVGIVAGLAVGDQVEQGQVIGYMGDSGNAEPGIPHLHFELRTPWSESVDPLPSLRNAAKRAPSTFAGLTEPPTSIGSPMVDVVDPADTDVVALAVSMGVPLACDRHAAFFCGGDRADEQTARAWIEALTTDPLDHTGTESDDELAPEDGGADGPPPTAERRRFLALCASDCVAELTRSQVSDLLVELDPNRWGAAGLADLYRSGLVDGCDGTPTPEDHALDRRGLLRMLMRIFGHLQTAPCELIS